MEKKFLGWIVLVGASLLNQGCSTVNESFDCQPKSGVGCHSISTVNQMVNEHNLGQEHAEINLKPTTSVNKSRYKMWIASYTDEDGVEHGEHEDTIEDITT